MLASLPFRRMSALGVVIAAALSTQAAAAQAPPDLPPLSGPPVGPAQASPPAQTPPPAQPPAKSPRPGYYPTPGGVYPPYQWGPSPAEVPPGFAVPYTMPYYYPQQPAGPRADEYNLPPPPPRRRNSTGMFVGGILMVSGGLVGVISGAVLVSSAANRIDIYCDSPSFPCAHMDDVPRRTAGVLLMAGGAILGALGVPVWLTGAKMVPATAAPAGTPGQPPQLQQLPMRPAYIPEVRIGAGAASVTVRF